MSLSTFAGHIKASISAWWQSWHPGAAIKAATDTINSLGLNEVHLEDVSNVILQLKNDAGSGLEKAVKAADIITSWTDTKALPSPALDNLHLLISLVHFIAKLSGKL